jgi:hypothetical protein
LRGGRLLPIASGQREAEHEAGEKGDR